MFGNRLDLLAVVAAAAWSSVAAAAPVTFSGGGVIARSIGSLPASGSAIVGDSIAFNFAFDLDAATLTFDGGTVASYSLPFTSFSATVGDYAFTPDGSNAQLLINRGFTFFGGTSTEPSRSFSFSFRGVPGADAPFTGALADQFTISTTFRDPIGPDQPVALGDVTDPSTADRRTFDYFGFGSGPPPLFSVLSGDYQGGFAAAPGAVPEPATWAMLMIGFGAIGASLRRRRTARPVLSRALS